MIGFKKLAHKITNLLLALFIISAQLFAPISAIVPTAVAAPPVKITAKTHEGQEAPAGTYTSGNTTTYTEEESINFHFTLSSTGTTNGQLEVRFTGDDSTCLFFDGIFNLGTHDSSAAAIVPVSGATPTVTTSGSPVATDFGTSSGEWVQTLDVAFTAEGEAVVNYWVTLSDEAGECNGSSQHSRLSPGGGDVDQTGQQNVPVPANQIIELPEIFVEKWVDTNADGVVDRRATSGEWSFSLDGGTPVATDANGKVTFTNVTPDGNHTVTESNGPAGQSFLSGSGTNCTFTGSAATATVASGTTATDATCIFNNGVSPGKIIVAKQTLPDGDQTSFNFTASYDNDGFSLSDGQQNDSGNLAAGNYSVTETVPTGWDLTNASCVSSIQDTETAGNLELDAGETITCTFTNTKRGQLVVQKTTNPAGDQNSFTINASTSNGEIIGSATGSITDSTDHTYTVKPGTYSVTETLPSGWSKDESACQNVVVAAGATVYCTITNTKLATIRIIKDALPNHSDNFAFITSALPGGGAFTLDDDSGATGEDTTYSNLQTFSDLTPGVAYSVTESSAPGWQPTNLTCDTGNWNVVGSQVTVTPTAGQTVTCTFENTKLRSISGTKYTSSATGGLGSVLSGWTIFIDANNNGTLDNGELSDTTDVNGNYSFDNLLPGNYILKELLQAGWTQIFAPDPVDLTYNADSTGNDFGNFENGSVSGYKWNDLDGDGGSVAEDGEPKLAGWTIKLFRSSDNTDGNYVEVDSTVTDANGSYSFTNLSPLPSRFYAVCEVQKNGWTQTAPQNNACRYFEMNTSGESNTGRNFGNQGRGTITVNKNVDTDGDGDVDVTGATDWTWDIAGGAQNTATGSSQNVAAGTYTVSEDQQANYHVVSVVCDTQVNAVSESAQVVVAPGANVTCTFTNARDTGTIEVIKQLNPTDDDGLFNLQINGETKKADASHGDTTGSVQVVTGDGYSVSEIAGEETDLENYDTTLSCTRNGQAFITDEATTSSDTFSISSEDEVICTFTNTRHGEIVVIKDAVPNHEQDFCFTVEEADLLLTLDNNSLYDEYLEGCDGFLLDDDDDETLSDTETTEVKPGLYEITEEEIEGWDLADIDCDNDIILFSQESDYPEYSTDYSREVFVEPGQTVTCTFTNEKRAEVVVTKYNDYNRNGEKDDNEPVLPGWEFTLESEEEDSFDICDIIPTFPGCEGEFDICELIPELCGDFNTFSFFPCGSFPFPPCDDDDYEYFKQQTTGEDGTTTFTDVKPGVDHFLSETEQDGWTWSDTDCEYEDRESYGQVVRENYYEIDASPGERVECFVGNYRDAYMLIEKTNDQPEPVNAGEVVTYTITVTVPEDSNPVYDATVTDLPPEGFVYIPGSETATQGSLTSPYASPGIWSLGDLFPGDIVVLTYQTRIASSASPGTYPDLAFASGCDIDAIAECDDEDEAGCELTKDEVVICDEENAVLANVTNIDKEGTPFVGTEVTIKAPQVLAANILINTGAADVWRNMMVGTLLMGVALAILYRREKKGYKL